MALCGAYLVVYMFFVHHTVKNEPNFNCLDHKGLKNVRLRMKE